MHNDLSLGYTGRFMFTDRISHIHGKNQALLFMAIK